MAKPAPITASGLIKTGSGLVTGFIVNSHTSGNLKLWDNTTATGTFIMDTFTFPTGSSMQKIPDPLTFTVGLYATIGGTANITLCYD